MGKIVCLRSSLHVSRFAEKRREWVGLQLGSLCAVLIAQSCLTLCDPMDCSTPGSSVHEDSLGKNTGEGCNALLQEILPTPASNPGLLYCRWILYQLSCQGSPRFTVLPSRFSHVQLCATPWTAAYQASLSMGFSRQEHWSGLPSPSPRFTVGELQWWLLFPWPGKRFFFFSLHLSPLFLKPEELVVRRKCLTDTFLRTDITHACITRVSGCLTGQNSREVLPSSGRPVMEGKPSLWAGSFPPPLWLKAWSLDTFCLQNSVSQILQRSSLQITRSCSQRTS